jgi:hypothetical protein
MDFENQDKEKDSNSSSGSFNGNSTNNSKACYTGHFFPCASDSHTPPPPLPPPPHPLVLTSADLPEPPGSGLTFDRTMQSDLYASIPKLLCSKSKVTDCLSPRSLSLVLAAEVIPYL